MCTSSMCGSSLCSSFMCSAVSSGVCSAVSSAVSSTLCSAVFSAVSSAVCSTMCSSVCSDTFCLHHNIPSTTFCKSRLYQSEKILSGLYQRLFHLQPMLFHQPPYIPFLFLDQSSSSNHSQELSKSKFSIFCSIWK